MQAVIASAFYFVFSLLTLRLKVNAIAYWDKEEVEEAEYWGLEMIRLHPTTCRSTQDPPRRGTSQAQNTARCVNCFTLDDSWYPIVGSRRRLSSYSARYSFNYRISSPSPWKEKKKDLSRYLRPLLSYLPVSTYLNGVITRITSQFPPSHAGTANP